MSIAEDYRYHIQRQRHCLEMARQATDPPTARIHMKIAAEHAKRAAELAHALSLETLEEIQDIDLADRPPMSPPHRKYQAPGRIIRPGDSGSAA